MPHAFRGVAESGAQTYQLKVDTNMSYEYSVQRNVDYLWRGVVDHLHRNAIITKIIVVSDGADLLLSSIPRQLANVQVVGVEQTSRGLRRLQDSEVFCPVISTAGTVAKNRYEAPMIAAAALAKMDSLGLISRRLAYGIVGSGIIGNQVAMGLRRRGHTALVYDPADVTGASTPSLEQLVQHSDVIIGTTGTDCLRGMHVERIRGKKIFISTSSSNIEFNYLFDLAKTYANLFEDVTLDISDVLTAVVMNGGYPINFDRTREWEPLDDIQFTRALIYAGVYDALTSPHAEAKIRPLRPDLEQAVTGKWLQLTDHSKP